MRWPVSVRISSFIVRRSSSEGVAQRPAQHCGAVEDLLRVQAQNRSISRRAGSGAPLQKPARRGLLREEQNAVLQVAENLVEILLQCGENLFHIAHALADLLDLCGDTLRRVALWLASASSAASPRLRSSSPAAG